jgi:DNA-binding transcriptional MerR regulator
MEKSLPAIPAKRYFTIGEVSELCGVKPYVLRYWEQEFTQLKPMKRRGNRRYYQHHEVLLIRRIRELLYEQGFTISGARNRLVESHHHAKAEAAAIEAAGAEAADLAEDFEPSPEAPSRRSSLADAERSLRTAPAPEGADGPDASIAFATGDISASQVREELLSIRGLLSV